MRCVTYLILLATLTLTLSSTIVVSQQAPAVVRTALTGATVIDVVAGTTVPNAVIVIQGDTITAFGGSTTPIPAGATRVDLSGKFIIPGLFDSHVHYQPFLGELYLNFGVTSVMALGARAPIGGDRYLAGFPAAGISRAAAVWHGPAVIGRLHQSHHDARPGSCRRAGMAEG